jgi:hypothetical protein
MAPQVHLMPSAKKKLDPALQGQVRGELGMVFSRAQTLSVYDVLLGFQADQQKKMILAVETESTSTDGRGLYEPHVVKLGENAEVVPDVAGWESCIRGRPMSQRMFVPVRLQKLAGKADRAAVIYQDAGQWHGMLTQNDEVATLAWAADKAVFASDEIEIASILRVIRQMFQELGRSLYTAASADAAATRRFYRAKLKLDSLQPFMHRWKEGPLWTLRRDVDWLLSGPISPASDALPDYLDPYDYVLWALKCRTIPPTLVGPSHGDFHAGNVIVGVNEEINEELANLIQAAGIERVKIRSVLTCETRRGVCHLCYGRNLATGKMVGIGEAVGVIAAQSIGEPGTQLTLRTFHIGGTASRIVEQSKTAAKEAGVVRFKDLAVVSYKDGVWVAVSRNGEIELMDSADSGRIRQRFTVPYGAHLFVKDGAKVTAEQALFEWDIYNHPPAARYIPTGLEAGVRSTISQRMKGHLPT